MLIKSDVAKINFAKVDEFIHKRLLKFEGVIPECFPILIIHMMSSSDVGEYAKSKGIAVYYSYDFE